MPELKVELAMVARTLPALNSCSFTLLMTPVLDQLRIRGESSKEQRIRGEGSHLLLRTGFKLPYDQLITTLTLFHNLLALEVRVSEYCKLIAQ